MRTDSLGAGGSRGEGTAVAKGRPWRRDSRREENSRGEGTAREQATVLSWHESLQTRQGRRGRSPGRSGQARVVGIAIAPSHRLDPALLFSPEGLFLTDLAPGETLLHTVRHPVQSAPFEHPIKAGDQGWRSRPPCKDNCLRGCHDIIDSVVPDRGCVSRDEKAEGVIEGRSAASRPSVLKQHIQHTGNSPWLAAISHGQPRVCSEAEPQARIRPAARPDQAHATIDRLTRECNARQRIPAINARNLWANRRHWNRESPGRVRSLLRPTLLRMILLRVTPLRVTVYFSAGLDRALRLFRSTRLSVPATAADRES